MKFLDEAYEFLKKANFFEFNIQYLIKSGNKLVLRKFEDWFCQPDRGCKVFKDKYSKLKKYVTSSSPKTQKVIYDIAIQILYVNQSSGKYKVSILEQMDNNINLPLDYSLIKGSSPIDINNAKFWKYMSVLLLNLFVDDSSHSIVIGDTVLNSKLLQVFSSVYINNGLTSFATIDKCFRELGLERINVLQYDMTEYKSYNTFRAAFRKLFLNIYDQQYGYRYNNASNVTSKISELDLRSSLVDLCNHLGIYDKYKDIPEFVASSKSIEAEDKCLSILYPRISSYFETFLFEMFSQLAITFFTEPNLLNEGDFVDVIADKYKDMSMHTINDEIVKRDTYTDLLKYNTDLIKMHTEIFLDSNSGNNDSLLIPEVFDYFKSNISSPPRNISKLSKLISSISDYIFCNMTDLQTYFYQIDDENDIKEHRDELSGMFDNLLYLYLARYLLLLHINVEPTYRQNNVATNSSLVFSNFVLQSVSLEGCEERYTNYVLSRYVPLGVYSYSVCNLDDSEGLITVGTLMKDEDGSLVKHMGVQHSIVDGDYLSSYRMKPIKRVGYIDSQYATATIEDVISDASINLSNPTIDLCVELARCDNFKCTYKEVITSEGIKVLYYLSSDSYSSVYVEDYVTGMIYSNTFKSTIDVSSCAINTMSRTVEFNGMTSANVQNYQNALSNLMLTEAYESSFNNGTLQRIFLIFRELYVNRVSDKRYTTNKAYIYDNIFTDKVQLVSSNQNTCSVDKSDKAYCYKKIFIAPYKRRTKYGNWASSDLISTALSYNIVLDKGETLVLGFIRNQRYLDNTEMSKSQTQTIWDDVE